MNARVNWKLENEVSKQVKEPVQLVSNVINLLEQDNTVPFIARYRQNLVKNMSSEKIREIKETMDEMKKVEKKALNAFKTLVKSEHRDNILEQSILSCTNEDDILELMAPFKASKKPSKLQQLHSLKLECHVDEVLRGGRVNLLPLVDKNNKNMKSMKEAEETLVTLAAERVSSQASWLQMLLELCEKANDVFVTSREVKSKKVNQKVNVSTFKEYFNFKKAYKYVKPYQYLAIQRGKSLNILKSEIETPGWLKDCLVKHLSKQYSNGSSNLKLRAFETAYDQFLRKKLLLALRHKLWKEAEDAAIRSFCGNVSQLLLEQPVRNASIMGVDPGFTNGCKFAVIDKKGKVLKTGKAMISMKNCSQNEVAIIRDALLSTNCQVVGVGNGVGCRETEEFFDLHIRKGTFQPLNVVFCTVRESGASIYSASSQAQVELPSLDITLRGAVSIARRLQDPLLELIKIDPKNLGVGMYQHDVTDSKLKRALGGVLEDCVSFVGVDVNCCGEYALQHVAGVGSTLAKKIIKKRQELGSFRSRKELLGVPGLGGKTFTQCAGFLRILHRGFDGGEAGGKNGRNGEKNDDEGGLSANVEGVGRGKGLKRKKNDGGGSEIKKYKQENIDTLDSTTVHPEAYKHADKLITMAGLDKSRVGEEAFAEGIRIYKKKHDPKDLAASLGIVVETLDQILDSLSQVTEFDIRSAFGKPLMRRGVSRISELKVGDVMVAKVMNITDFGIFVDIGVEREALIHSSQLPTAGPSINKNDKKKPRLGDVLQVKVLSVEGNRVGLKPVDLL